MWLLATIMDYEAEENENTIKVFKEIGTFIPQILQSRTSTSKAQGCGRKGQREGRRKVRKKERGGGVLRATSN